MFRILRVAGGSLYPDFQEGDFVVIATRPFFLRRLRRGDVVVFRHEAYGTLIKRVTHVLPEEVYVLGARQDSVDSRRLGPIRRQAITGKVIWHISKPRESAGE